MAGSFWVPPFFPSAPSTEKVVCAVSWKPEWDSSFIVHSKLTGIWLWLGATGFLLFFPQHLVQKKTAAALSALALAPLSTVAVSTDQGGKVTQNSSHPCTLLCCIGTQHLLINDSLKWVLNYTGQQLVCTPRGLLEMSSDFAPWRPYLSQTLKASSLGKAAFGWIPPCPWHTVSCPLATL